MESSPRNPSPSKRKGEDYEHRTYDEVHQYLSDESYPVGSTKAEKAVIQKREKKIEIVSGVLHYRGPSLREVITDRLAKDKILMPCHDDNVGGCPF